MALTDKKYEKFYKTTGTGDDKVDSGKLTFAEEMWDVDRAIGMRDHLNNVELAPIIFQLQQIQDELDYLRTEISTNKDKNGISTSQASAITANTAKTGITNSQSTMITDNMTEAKRLGGLIDTNTRSTTNNASTISNLINNKLEIIPNRNGSVKQGLTCGVVERLGVYMLNFAYEDVDKAGKTITKTGSIQLK